MFSDYLCERVGKLTSQPPCAHDLGFMLGRYNMLATDRDILRKMVAVHRQRSTTKQFIPHILNCTRPFDKCPFPPRRLLKCEAHRHAIYV